MLRTFMRSKIHRATVTGSDLDYVGSLTLSPDLLKAADIGVHELVQVVNINNGARFETYAIAGTPGAGDVIANGAAARLVQRGDKIIIITYAQLGRQRTARLPAADRPRGRREPDQRPGGTRKRVI